MSGKNGKASRASSLAEKGERKRRTEERNGDGTTNNRPTTTTTTFLTFTVRIIIPIIGDLPASGNPPFQTGLQRRNDLNVTHWRGTQQLRTGPILNDYYSIIVIDK